VHNISLLSAELFDTVIKWKRDARERLTVHYFFQLMSGVRYLHNVGYAHRDLKLENLLLSKDGVLKIADFGVSKEIKFNPMKTCCGSPDYIAPGSLQRASRTVAFVRPPVYIAPLHRTVEAPLPPPPPSHTHTPVEAILDGGTGDGGLGTTSRPHVTLLRILGIWVNAEILSEKSGYDGRLADIWSCGVILYTMLCGEFPFESTAHIMQAMRGARIGPAGRTRPIRTNLSEVDPLGEDGPHPQA
jgi:serine/threonine protein kinase